MGNTSIRSTWNSIEGSLPPEEDTLDVLSELARGLDIGGIEGGLWSKTRISDRDGETLECLNDKFVIPSAEYQVLDPIDLQQIVLIIEIDESINRVKDRQNIYSPDGSL